jgi:uncharacterized membrane protein
VGGLFLAFPAILPSSLTLVAAHQQKRKAQQGLQGAVRGGRAAALDALGAALGGVGLLFFAAITWQLLPRYPPAAVLSSATFVWACVSYALWGLRKPDAATHNPCPVQLRSRLHSRQQADVGEAISVGPSSSRK